MVSEKSSVFEVEWVNHASYVIKFQEIQLLVDPWIFGDCFDDSWSLLVDSAFTLNDFERITHIWFSHEHPDHFSPWVLSAIPKKYRESITVLFQETSDKRVINFCKKLFSKVEELPDRKSFLLSDVFKLTCGKMMNIDSWLLAEIDNTKILNLNDCVIDSPQLVKSIKKITGEVDILLTQFSYANWEGNPEETEKRLASASEKLERVNIQVRGFSPKYVIPFASFVYFSHSENRYMNDAINSVDRVNSFLLEHTNSKPLVFYPGDRWSYGEVRSNTESLKKYKEHYEKINKKKFKKSNKPITNDILGSLAENYIRNLKKKNSLLILKLLNSFPKNLGFKRLVIKLSDTGQICEFDLIKGLSFHERGSIVGADVELSSNSLNQILKFEWGIGTVLINARFKATEKGYRIFKRIFVFGIWNSVDRYLCSKTILKLMLMFLLLGKKLKTYNDFSFYKSWQI